jgi:ribosome-associated protein
MAGRRWTKDGALLLRADAERSQARNREAARARLVEMIRAACVKPKRRVPTKVPAGQKKRRVEEKRRRGVVKGLRGGVGGD